MCALPFEIFVTFRKVVEVTFFSGVGSFRSFFSITTKGVHGAESIPPPYPCVQIITPQSDRPVRAHYDSPLDHPAPGPPIRSPKHLPFFRWTHQGHTNLATTALHFRRKLSTGSGVLRIDLELVLTCSLPATKHTPHVLLSHVVAKQGSARVMA